MQIATFIDHVQDDPGESDDLLTVSTLIIYYKKYCGGHVTGVYTTLATCPPLMYFVDFSHWRGHAPGVYIH